MTWRSRKREQYTRVPAYIPIEHHMPTVSKGECMKMDDNKSVLTNDHQNSLVNVSMNDCRNLFQERFDE